MFSGKWGESRGVSFERMERILFLEDYLLCDLIHSLLIEQKQEDKLKVIFSLELIC